MTAPLYFNHVFNSTQKFYLNTGEIQQLSFKISYMKNYEGGGFNAIIRY